MTRPNALDLFCGAGGATMGLQQAGFRVTGIDIRPQPRYCGDDFVQADALAPPVDLRAYDFVWASPPCQAYSVASVAKMRRGKSYPDLIPATRALLNSAGVPWTIENVVGAPMSPASVTLCGLMFGLRVFRHRRFESSFPIILTPPHGSHAGKRIGEGYYSVAGHAGRWKSWGTVRRDVSKGSAAEWRAAMGIGWMTRHELSQAIPPAYAEFVGRAAKQSLRRCA